jgi:hypothetical protein
VGVATGFGGRVITKIPAAAAASPRPARTGISGLLFWGFAAMAAAADARGLVLAELFDAGFALAGADGRLDGCEGGGGIEGVSSSKSGDVASGVVFARSPAPASSFAITWRSTMPESCSGFFTLTGGGGGVFEDEGPSDGELASFASSCRLRRSRWEGGPLLIVS